MTHHWTREAEEQLRNPPPDVYKVLATMAVKAVDEVAKGGSTHAVLRSYWLDVVDKIVGR